VGDDHLLHLAHIKKKLFDPEIEIIKKRFDETCQNFEAKSKQEWNVQY
jgi:hypothetical protein